MPDMQHKNLSEACEMEHGLRMAVPRRKDTSRAGQGTFSSAEFTAAATDCGAEGGAHIEAYVPSFVLSFLLSSLPSFLPSLPPSVRPSFFLPPLPLCFLALLRLPSLAFACLRWLRWLRLASLGFACLALLGFNRNKITSKSKLRWAHGARTFLGCVSVHVFSHIQETTAVLITII